MKTLIPNLKIKYGSLSISKIYFILEYEYNCGIKFLVQVSHYLPKPFD